MSKGANVLTQSGEKANPTSSLFINFAATPFYDGFGDLQGFSGSASVWLGEDYEVGVRTTLPALKGDDTGLPRPVQNATYFVGHLVSPTSSFAPY